MSERFKLGSKEKEVLQAIGLGLLFLTTPSPKLTKELLAFLKRKGPNYLNKMLKKMEKNDIINLGGEKVFLTKKGKELLKVSNLINLEIAKPEKWDGIWRLVSYDIPDISKKKRDWFRGVLEDWGFEKIQESLWVYPFECKEEVAIVAKNLGISGHVIHMTTDHLPRQKEIERLYGV